MRVNEGELKLLKLCISGTIYSRYIAILQRGLWGDYGEAHAQFYKGTWWCLTSLHSMGEFVIVLVVDRASATEGEGILYCKNIPSAVAM